MFGAKDPEPEYKQVVFIDAHNRYKYLIEQAQQQQENNKSVLLLAWFPKTLDDLEFLLNKLDIPYVRGFSASRLTQPGICIDLAENVMQAAAGSQPLDVAIVLAEHYPLYDRELSLLRHLQKLSRNQTTIVASMDEPAFELFGGERIRQMMLKMDIKPEEAIEHSMVSSSVKRAQQKLQDKVGQDKPASSQEEWVKLNYPDKN